MDNFSMKPVKFLAPEEGESVPWITVVTSMFHHSSLMHHLTATMAAYSLIGQSVSPVVGPARAFAAWFGIGVMGHLIELGALKVLKQDDLKAGKHLELIETEVQKRNIETGERTMEKVMAVKPEYYSSVANHVGSSGGLMGMMTIVALMSPGARFGLPILPISFTSRTFAGLIVAWDFAGVAGLLGQDGISHWGHLCGDLIGAIVWFAWFKRLPAAKVWQKTKFYRGE